MQGSWQFIGKYIDALSTVGDGLWKTGLGFVICVVLYFGFEAIANRRFSVRQILTDAFPKRLYNKAGLRVDFWNSVIHYLAVEPLRLLLFAAVAVWAGLNVADQMATWFGPRPRLIHAAWAIGTVQFIGGLLGGSFFDYWIHRANHQVPWLWSLHRAHHSTESLTLFARARAHPIDSILILGVGSVGGALGSGLALYLIGGSVWTPSIADISIFTTFALYLWSLSVETLGHSHIPVSFGRLSILISPPVGHQIHHSAELRHRDKNFSAGLLFWDWLFGTLYLPKKGETYRWGLNEDELGDNNPHKTVTDLYIEPLAHMWRELKKVGGRGRANSSPPGQLQR